MSAALVLPLETGHESLPRKRFTREDLDRLMEAGVFEGQRYELIGGDLIDKMGQNPPHAKAIRVLAAIFVRIFDALLIRVQQPMEAARSDRERSLPEPDVAIM